VFRILARDMKPSKSVDTIHDLHVPSETHTGTMASAEEQSVEPFEVLLEELQWRSNAKTFVMEEALRFERSQGRFWGINE